MKLPPAQPMASIDAEVAKRCFIVCGPPVPPIYTMKDAFCRFGNLIDVYMLPGKNCGYAKYASVESANKAIQVIAIGFQLELFFSRLFSNFGLFLVADSTRSRDLWLEIKGIRG